MWGPRQLTDDDTCRDPIELSTTTMTVTLDGDDVMACTYEFQSSSFSKFWQFLTHVRCRSVRQLTFLSFLCVGTEPRRFFLSVNCVSRS